MGTVGEKETKELLQPDPETGRLGELVQRITEDLKSIGRDEVQLARTELTQRAKLAAVDAGVVILSGVVLAIAIGFVCVAAVDALAPLIPPLWARLLIMAAVYAAICAGLIFSYAKRLKRHVTPPMPETKAEAKRTVDAVKEELRHA
jgi:Putative Actinobacterial Holin-X, holin superfamily III